MPDPILQNLHTMPKSSDAYLWCDYVELRCLAHSDHRFSRGDLLELFDESGDDAPQLIGGADDDLNGDADDGFPEDADDHEDAVEADDDDPLPASDRHEAKAADIFKNIAYRASIFGEAYPFCLDVASQEISLRAFAEPSRKLYLQLLLSASLRLVPKTRRHELTEPFEKLSTRIFSCLMPQGWEVHQFGAKGVARYKGHLYSRLVKLAEDLRGTLEVKKHHFKTRNAGDGGLDIVAWHPMGGDTRAGIPIALAQCGCTAEEWSLKSLEASPSVLGANLTTLHPWATYYFMPQDLVDGRDGQQDWQRRPSLTKCVVIDRIRLIRLAHQYGVAEQCATASERVAEAS